MASLKSLNETRMRDLITCSVCLEVLTDPKVLPCLHSYCSHCLQGMWTPPGRHIVCPVCKDTSKMPANGVKGLKSDFKTEQLKELLDVEANGNETASPGGVDRLGVLRDLLKQNTCEVCKACAATAHCAQCSVFYCGRCIKRHEGNALFKAHQVVSLCTQEEDEESSTDGHRVSTSFCTNHPGHRFRFLCTTCHPRVPLCPICVLQHGNEDAATDQTSSVSSSISSSASSSAPQRHDICDINDAALHFGRKLRADLRSVHAKMAVLRQRKSAADELRAARGELLSELHEAVCLQALLVVAKVEDAKTRTLHELEAMVASLLGGAELQEDQVSEQLHELTGLETELRKAITDGKNSRRSAKTTVWRWLDDNEQLDKRLELLKKLNISGDTSVDGSDRRSIRFIPNKEELDQDIVGRLEFFTAGQYDGNNNRNVTKKCTTKDAAEKRIIEDCVVKTERHEVITHSPNLNGNRNKIVLRRPKQQRQPAGKKITRLPIISDNHHSRDDDNHSVGLRQQQDESHSSSSDDNEYTGTDINTATSECALKAVDTTGGLADGENSSPDSPDPPISQSEVAVAGVAADEGGHNIRVCGRRRGGHCESCDRRTAALISFYSKRKERLQKLCRHCRALSDVNEDMK